MEKHDQIQIEDDIKYQHFISHNSKHYPIIFDYFLSFSQYFKKNQKELENKEFIDLIDEESEDKKDIPDEIIKCFIDFVQREPIALTDANVFLLNYLGRKYEVLQLIESTNKYIDEHKEGDDIHFLLINQNNNEIETTTQEDSISNNFLDHIKDERLLDLNFPVLCRILEKYKNQSDNKEINDDLINFYLECIGKYGAEASKFFEDVDLSKIKAEHLKKLISLNDFDYHYVNSNAVKTIYDIQQDILSKTASTNEKIREQDETINELKKIIAEQKDEISNMQKDITKLMECQTKKEEEDDIQLTIQNIQKDITKLKKFRKEQVDPSEDIESLKKSVEKIKKRQAEQKSQKLDEDEVQQLKDKVDDLTNAFSQYKKESKNELNELKKKYNKIIDDQNEEIEDLKKIISSKSPSSSKPTLKKPTATKRPTVSYRPTRSESGGDSSDNENNSDDDTSGETDKIEIKKILTKPFGIRNLGNTCFMNSALQCILSLPIFINNIEEMISKSTKKDLLTAFKTFITSSNHGPVRIKNLAAKRNPIFSGNNQQDSFEFAITIINQITEDCKEKGNEIFVGNCDMITECAKCGNESKIEQNFCSICLCIQKSRRILYIPYKMKNHCIALGQKPEKKDKISTLENYKKITINDYILATKNKENFVEINEILPSYSNTYAFELPESQLSKNKGYIVVKLKDEKGIPITQPFLIEVSTTSQVKEDKLKLIIVKRLYDLISSDYKTKSDDDDDEEEDDEDDEDKNAEKVFNKIKDNIEFTKPNKFPTKFTKKKKICDGYINVRVTKEGIFDFSSRSQQNQKAEFTLEQLFNSNIQKSQLEPGNKYTNDCEEKSRVFQRNKYTKLPKVLIFQIKRSSGPDVDESKVSFPNSISISVDDDYNSIKIDPDEDEQNRYELRAISHHVGSFLSGHYWAVGKRGEKWYNFNDSDVNPLSPDEPFEATGSSHIAFYQMIE